MQTPPDFQDFFAANVSTWDERAAIHFRDATGFYAIDRFRAGEDMMLPIESREIGYVAGKHLLHLQCHIGVETLCLARRGAIVTGLDFSATSIAAARALARETGLARASFVEANVYDALKVLKGGFDIIYVSWGSLNWLPDIRRWGRIIADLLALGGYLYLVEQHPGFSTAKERDGRIEVTYAWETPPDKPVVIESTATYNGDATPLAHARWYEWKHPFSAIIGSLVDRGLRLDFLREHETLAWRRLPMMESADDGMFRLPPGEVRRPLAFSLKASKPFR